MPSYRILEPDEIIKKGDECKSATGKWFKALDSIGSKPSKSAWLQFRRRIHKKKISPGKGYRLLEKCEVIKEGDEYWYGKTNEWRKSSGPEYNDPVGSPSNPNLKYRRKVEEPQPALTFLGELEQLINKHSKENDSNTPDFILAEYLKDCLEAFGKATRGRDKWYGTEGLTLSNNSAAVTRL